MTLTWCRRAAITGGLLLWATAVHAEDVCTKSGRPIPHCVPVSSPKIGLKVLQTKGWSVSCPKATPFFWGTWTAAKSSGAVSVVTDPFTEGASNGAWTMTNWTTSPQTLTLAIGCSAVSPSGVACDWSVCMNPITGCQAEECQVCLTQYACRWQFNKAAGCTQNACVEFEVYACDDGQQQCLDNLDRPEPPPP